MKKKITWVSSDSVPPEKYVSSDFGEKNGIEIPLLLLMADHPYPVTGIYRRIVVGVHPDATDKKNVKVLKKRGYFHAYGSRRGAVVAWRPMPKIPVEFHKVTGYDRIIRGNERAETRKVKSKISQRD